jgi:hypothetical protein
VNLVSGIACGTVANARYGVVVIDLIDSANCGTRSARSCESTDNCTNNSSNWSGHASCCRADGNSAQSAQRGAFFGVIVGIVVDSMLH